MLLNDVCFSPNDQHVLSHAVELKEIQISWLWLTRSCADLFCMHNAVILDLEALINRFGIMCDQGLFRMHLLPYHVSAHVSILNVDDSVRDAHS